MNDQTTPIPMRLTCPKCGELHVDEGEFATRIHHTHSCQFCGLTWRPAVVATVGVRFLPGFKNEEPPVDWKGVLPHHLRVQCAKCENRGEAPGTNAPGVFGWTFADGEWWCEKHSLRRGPSHADRVECDDCKKLGGPGAKETNDPKMFGWTFEDGEWRCKDHTRRRAAL